MILVWIRRWFGLWGLLIGLPVLLSAQSAEMWMARGDSLLAAFDEQKAMEAYAKAAERWMKEEDIRKVAEARIQQLAFYTPYPERQAARLALIDTLVPWAESVFPRCDTLLARVYMAAAKILLKEARKPRFHQAAQYIAEARAISAENPGQRSLWFDTNWWGCHCHYFQKDEGNNPRQIALTCFEQFLQDSLSPFERQATKFGQLTGFRTELDRQVRYQEWLDLVEELPDTMILNAYWLGEGRVPLRIARLAIKALYKANQGDYQQSLAANREQLRWAQAHLPPDSWRQSEYWYHAGRGYLLAGNWPQSEAALLRSYDILAEQDLLYRSADVCSVLGNLYARQSRWQEAETYFSRNISLRQNTHVDASLYDIPHAMSLYNLGTACFSLGNYEEATRLFKQVEQTFVQQLGPSHPYVAHVLTSLGMAEGMLYDASAKLPYLRRAVRMYAPSAIATSVGEQERCAIALRQLAYTLSMLGMHQAAQDTGLLAWEVLSQRPKAISEQRVAAYFLGDIYRHAGNLPESGHWYQRAMDLPEPKDGVAPSYYDDNRAELRQHLAQLQLQLGNPDSAQQLAKDALLILDPGGKMEDWLCDIQQPANDDLYKFANCLGLWSCASLQRFHASKSRHDLTRAQAGFTATFHYLSTFQTQGSQQEALLTLLEDFHSIITAAHRAHYLAYQFSPQDSLLTAAFQLAEQTRAFRLRQQLRQRSYQLTYQLPQALANLESRTHTNLAFYEERLMMPGEASDSAQQDWQQRVLDLGLRKDSLQRVFRTQYPAYHHMRYGQQALDLDTLRAALKPGQIVLDYVWTDSACYVLLLHGQGGHMMEVHDVDSLQARIDRLLPLLADEQQLEQGSPAQRKALAQTSHALYQQLVAPAEAYLQAEGVPAKRLLILPDRALSQVPFEALLTEATEQSAYASLPYLLRKYAISYAATLRQLLPVPRPVDSEAPEGLLAFGVTAAPDLSNQQISSARDLGQLLYAGEEAQTVAQLTDGQALINQAATEAQFRAQAPQHQLLHLAMHAWLDEAQPLNTCLWFHPDSSSAQADGRLFAYEIYNLKLPASLAVLSACRSSAGPWQTGEGTQSLAHAFAFAGTEAVLAARWPADDQSSAELMRLFYEALAEGMSKDEALRQAQLRYLEEAPLVHPYFWSGWMLQGQPAPIEVDRFGEWRFMWWGLGGLGLLLLLGGVRGWARRLG